MCSGSTPNLSGLDSQILFRLKIKIFIQAKQTKLVQAQLPTFFRLNSQNVVQAPWPESCPGLTTDVLSELDSQFSSKLEINRPVKPSLSSQTKLVVKPSKLHKTSQAPSEEVKLLKTLFRSLKGSQCVQVEFDSEKIRTIARPSIRNKKRDERERVALRCVS